ncbi:MAG: helix-hairpin-helix domain-containing protein [Flavobacteriales bacterium]|nr:helix-hairpin-helix domain-containing protein [Flavobacteriales bacterium]
MRWRQVLRNYFTFNRRERRGIILLLAVLGVLLCVQVWLRMTPSALEVTDALDPSMVFVEDPRVSRQAFLDTMVDPEDSVEVSRSLDGVVWHPFDPNTATSEDLHALGLDERIAERLVHFREKGGTFSGVADLHVVYGMDSSWVDAAASYVTIEVSPMQEQKQKEREEKVQMALIDLNRADTTALMSIRGVGAFYAREVVKLRDRLGGFFRYDQLLDVYHMRDETLTNIAENSFIDTTLVTKININACSVDPLGKHPYLTWKQAKVIVSYRQQHGPYSHPREITNTRMVSDSIYLKIAPYLISR